MKKRTALLYVTALVVAGPPGVAAVHTYRSLRAIREA